MITKDTYVDVRGFTETEFWTAVINYLNATGATVDYSDDSLEVLDQNGWVFLTVIEDCSLDHPKLFVVNNDMAMGKQELTKQQVLQWPYLDVEEQPFECPLKKIMSEPLPTPGVDDIQVMPSVTDIQVMFDIDCFRNAVGIIKANNKAACRYSDGELEKKLKGYAQEVMQRAIVKLVQEPEYEGSFYMGTCNFRVALEWMDESTLELVISIKPDMGTLVGVSLVEIEDALRMSL